MRTKISKIFLSNILNIAGDPFFVKNNKSQFILVNNALCNLLGIPREDIIGKTLSESLPKNQMDHFFQIDRLVLESGVENICEEYITRYDGKILTIETTKTLYIDEKGKKFIVGVIRDITARKEEEIKLKKANEEKDKFFSIIAHDLRGPFNGFLGLTEVIVENLQEMKLSEIQEIMISVRNSARNLFGLLENLLKWSLVKRGFMSFVPELILLCDKTGESIQSILQSAEKKEIKIQYDIPLDLTIFADVNMFKSIMSNLVFNAIKFTNIGGIIFLSAKKKDEDNFIQISVKDTGIGMSSSIVHDLFEIHVQTNRKGTEGEPSSGLGLILCKEFVEKHGGKIWVESQEGEGTTFHFTLPTK